MPEIALRLIGVVDLSAGLGLLLPTITRIAPRLTVWAAAGSIALQVCAMAFHFIRGEYPVILMNVVIIALSAFVLWGRAGRAAVTARRTARAICGCCRSTVDQLTAGSPGTNPSRRTQAMSR